MEPPQSLDFFLLIFLGTSGRLCAGDTLSKLDTLARPGSMGSRFSWVASVDSLELLDDLLDCLDFSVFSLIGDPVALLLDDALRLDDLGNSGKSLAGEFGARAGLLVESIFQSKCIINVFEINSRIQCTSPKELSLNFVSLLYYFFTFDYGSTYIFSTNMGNGNMSIIGMPFINEELKKIVIRLKLECTHPQFRKLKKLTL